MFEAATGRRRRDSFQYRFKRGLIKAVLIVLGLPVLLIAAMRWINPLTTAFMVETKIGLYVHGAPKTRIRQDWVSYEKISPAMRLAVVAAEDQRFPDHGGFDWRAIEKAHRSNLRSTRIRGASTISQQVAKNIFLWQDHSYLRKGVEAYLTFFIELLWPKQRILEVYLNIAQFDQRIFGVGAASKLILNTTPDRINSSQAALLAAVLPSPVRYHATAPSRFVRSRQYWVLTQMAGLGPHYLGPIEER